MKVNVIIACGGKGNRVGLGFNKLLAKLDGEAVIFHTVSKFLCIESVTKLIISTSLDDIEPIKSALSKLDGSSEIVYCVGGNTRTDSIISALKNIDNDADIITIHDGARPYVTIDVIKDSIDTAIKYGSGIASIPSTDTIAVVDNNKIIDVPDRAKLYNIQTPQSFNAQSIIKAYSMIQPTESFTDDSSVYQKFIGQPTLSKGDISNKKITYYNDLINYTNCYIGVGYDTHRLVPDRKLVLGGITIPHPLGLLGHSDADVLTHAIMDAIFNACGERDIGVHFPDNDPKYKGIDSTILLAKCMDIIRKKGYEVKNISCVIMCEKPKLAKLIPSMIDNLTKCMNIPLGTINIGATTTEGLGLVGREEGISVHANCICYKL